MAQVRVRYWAGAREAAGVDDEPVEGGSVGALRQAIAGRNERLAEVCAVSSFLVDGVHADDDVALHAGQVVEVLPPFAGG